jgi:hypothetical protein
MPLMNLKIRYFLAFLVGFIFAIFGVFIFSDFLFRGMRLEDEIFPSIISGDFNTFWAGIYQLVGSGFSADLFSLFSIANIQTSSFFGILFSETVWATILTWWTVGFFMGVVIKGVKQSLLSALILFAGLGVIYFVAAMFAGANVAGSNILITLGQLTMGLVCIIPASIIGGILGGIHD